MDCVLPATGSDPFLVVLPAILVLGAGVALVLGVRRRGFGGGAAVVLAFALASAAVVVSDARGAHAQDCPPSTTVAPTAAPTTVAVTTTAAATTTTTSSTTTTVAATTTTVAGGGVPTNPTFPTTTAATTTTPALAPDLSAEFTTCQSPITPGDEWLYIIRVRNVGSAPTDSQPMTFTLSLPVTVPVSGVVVEVDPGDAILPTGWSPTITPGTVGPPGTPTTVTITSDSGVVILPNGSVVVLLLLAWPSADAGAFSVDVELPDGIGGEPSAANGNNMATCAVTVTPSGAQPTG